MAQAARLWVSIDFSALNNHSIIELHVRAHSKQIRLVIPSELSATNLHEISNLIFTPYTLV